MKAQSPLDPARDVDRIIPLVAAITFTAAIALGFVVADDSSGSHTRATDSSAGRGAVQVPAPAAPVTPQAGELDPSLRRIDYAGAHHG